MPFCQKNALFGHRPLYPYTCAHLNIHIDKNNPFFNVILTNAAVKSVLRSDLCPFLLRPPTDPVCGPEAGVHQAALQDRPALPVPLHLPVLHRQLQLR